MTEQELISLFDRFGYSVLKSDGKFTVFNQKIEKYSIFDRRTARRVAETDSLDGLSHYANDIFCFPMWSDVLEKTIDYFKEAYSCSPVTDPETKTEPETVTGEEESPADPEPDTEPEQTEPDSPVLYTMICKGCGKEFQTPRKQVRYCSPECYPSNKEKKSPKQETPESSVSVIQRPI